MYCVRNITDDLYYVGASDRRLHLFENVYPAPNGASYNSYVLLDEKTVLFDTADKAVADQLLDNLTFILNGRTLDYLIVHHMEPDHSTAMAEIVRRYPDVKLVMSAKALQMAKQFYNFDADARAHIVTDGDTLSTGKHDLTFITAPMVHWPEVIMSYDRATNTLFSADAFGTFGALGGNIFSDELDMTEWVDEARRYYANIVGKYGAQVQAVMKKTAALDIRMICPLHGPILRDGIPDALAKYQLWSTYQPEETCVLVAYASVYGHTENAANVVAARLADRGARVRVFDVSKTHASYLVAEAFRASHLVLAAPTYNMGVFSTMRHFIDELCARGLKGRTVAIIENGSWAPASGNLMRQALGDKNTVLDACVTIASAPDEPQRAALCALADEILNTMPGMCPRDTACQGRAIDSSALFKLSYGLFVLSAREGDKDNGCIINTAGQLTSTPTRVSITVNKQNLTHDMVARTGLFTVSVLDVTAPFELFKRFGFQSGGGVDKFAGFDGTARDGAGILYLTQHANAYLSCRVVKQMDCGTHTLFVGELTEAKVLGEDAPVTYAHYFEHIKPKPAPKQKKNGFVCKICGYIYEGDTLPADFICPICKHGAADFEPLT